MSDFEKAIRNVYCNIWIEIELLGYHFHYGQCCFKKIIEVGLKVEYSKNEKRRFWLRKLIGLGLVDLTSIEEVYCTLIDKVFEFEDPVKAKLVEFVDDNYYPTWFSNGEDGDAPSTYRRSEWNHFENDGNRTNNHNEAYNGKLDWSCRL